MPYQRFSTTTTSTNATPFIAFSTPIAAGTSAFVEVDFQVVNATLSNGAGGKIYALFTRTSGGNVVRATGNNGLLGATLNFLGNFTTNPNVELVANTASQTADLRFTGLLATTLTWKFTANVRRN